MRNAKCSSNISNLGHFRRNLKYDSTKRSRPPSTELQYSISFVDLSTNTESKSDSQDEEPYQCIYTVIGSYSIKATVLEVVITSAETTAVKLQVLPVLPMETRYKINCIEVYKIKNHFYFNRILNISLGDEVTLEFEQKFAVRQLE